MDGRGGGAGGRPAFGLEILSKKKSPTRRIFSSLPLTEKG
jgi:hypothetical protein